MADVLVIDDDHMIREMIADIVVDLGHSCASAATMTEGLLMAENAPPDIVFLDVFLPDGNGIDALSALTDTGSSPEVIVISGAGVSEPAEKAMEIGAWDYIQKPFSLKNVVGTLERALTYKKEHRIVKNADTIRRDGIAGNSPITRVLLDNVALAADSDAGVLITGETGTGKEVFARAIHDNSRRASGPFVVVDCASLTETLVESILFGHKKGSFTGAEDDREGLILQADGGTLFLDEVGELPYGMQKAFLRVLEDRSFRPVGDREEMYSNFRLVAATNRNLDRMVEKGRFRRDLLFRIRSFHMELPALSDRRDDIRDICRHHIEKLSKRKQAPPKDISPEVMQAFSLYPWPGNIRELVHTVEAGMAAARDESTLYVKHLPKEIRMHYAKGLVLRNEESGTGAGSAEKEHKDEAFWTAGGHMQKAALPQWSEYREKAMDQAEKKYFVELLDVTQGKVKTACDMAGISRARLYQILQKHDIRRLK